MKQLNFLILAAVAIIAVSCKKDKPTPVPIQIPVDTVIIPSPVNDTVEVPLDDTARVLLKDIVINSLPSPYYHFEYDNLKYVTKIGFASNFDVYDVTYVNKRVNKLTNINNGRQLLYTYANDKVSLITEFTLAGTKGWEYRLVYNGLNQLTELNWIEFPNPGGAGSAFKKIILSYLPGGNLGKIEKYFRGTSGQLEWSSTTEFRDYDTTVNVDDFSMTKEFFESFLFLPGVKLQQNNHHTEVITGSTNDYLITYSYNMVNGLPVKENGSMVQTRGSNAGQTFTFEHQFSYY